MTSKLPARSPPVRRSDRHHRRVALPGTARLLRPLSRPLAQPEQGSLCRGLARKRGLVRSIGVCNFLPVHLGKIIQETGVTPAINQVEVHPYFPQAEQRAWDKARGIVTQAWSPLGRANLLLQDPAIKAVADRLDKTIPQVILRWHIQLGAIPLPKAVSEARQIENLSVFEFELPPGDMDAIATFARPDGRTFDQDPARYEEF